MRWTKIPPITSSITLNQIFHSSILTLKLLTGHLPPCLHRNLSIKFEQSTNTRTGNPLFRRMLTTLLPTPPVAPETSTIPEESIAVTSSLGAGLDSFSIKNSKNFKSKRTWSEWHAKLEFHIEQKVEEKAIPTLTGDGGPLKKYNVFTNLPKSHPCFPASA